MQSEPTEWTREARSREKNINRKERETLEDKTGEKKLELTFSWRIMFGIVPLDFLDYSRTNLSTIRGVREIFVTSGTSPRHLRCNYQSWLEVFIKRPLMDIRWLAIVEACINRTVLERSSIDIMDSLGSADLWLRVTRFAYNLIYFVII